MNVLITGANRGIGLGFAKQYLAQGCDVWACHRSDPGELNEIENTRLHLLEWDVSQDQQPGFIVEACAIPKHLDLLINNAGIYGPKKEAGQSLETVSSQTMMEVFDVNCVSVLRVVQQLRESLIEARGVIANVSSKMGSSGDNTSGGSYAYRAAKAALVIVSKSMAMDLDEKGVRVITLHPGWVRTDMTDHSGLIDVEQAVSGMANVIAHVDDYGTGAFVAFDGQVVPY